VCSSEERGEGRDWMEKIKEEKESSGRGEGAECVGWMKYKKRGKINK
jgi:hypothetical protein